PEEVSTEESTEEETSEDVDTDLLEDASKPEEVSTEETTEEETFTEESTEEETSEDVDTDLPEVNLQQEKSLVKKSVSRSVTRSAAELTPTAVYQAMIALKDQDAYKEGTTWTNDDPSSGYHWNGGPINGDNITAFGCAAFACILSDAAFGNLTNRMYIKGQFAYEDIKVGDILRVNNNTHSVIVLQVSDAGVIVAEGNYNGTIHWGRVINKSELMDSIAYYITRYPESYVAPDDPSANESLANGTLDGGLTWNLTKAGTLTISGNGAMPDYSSAGEQPWKANSDTIQKVVIGNGVTSIGSCAFWDCKLLSVEIPSSVTTIGSNAFYGSSIMSVTIPASVKTIGDSAFRNCQNLCSVTVSNGVETIEQNAFRACTSLTSVSLPSSITKVGSGAFFECKTMKSATFASDSKQVKLGDDIFARCWELTSIKLPANIDRIGEGMFMNCLMLTRVEIPQGAESIGNDAFASCSKLTAVVIPDSITTIGTGAFSNCSLADIYFTGTETQWNSISKTADVITAVSTATIHYNYVPTDSSDSDEGNNNDSNNSGNGNNNNSSTSDNSGDNHDGDRPGNYFSESDSDEDTPDTNVSAKSWKPTTPDEIRRYAFMGKEDIRYTVPKGNAYPVDIENAMQGPMCFQSFESVLGDYTIGRTYNIHAVSDTTYSTDQEIQLTIEIPSAICKEDREYKMICVTKGGKPIVYDDLDSDPKTITIETDKFYAYALIYKDK
ncbi:MAG: leucine-rich repeat domain-containing protein, partial [Lachnospiraceae bacterium]|nr:leucine-rich repeat domain-containing protein [Lachnospiraceae bacterium]